MKYFLQLAFVVFCLALTHCSGEECSATDTYFTDQDSDCREDSEDNCVSHYNPNQEDLDDDGFGDACETPECIENDQCINLIYGIFSPEYNLRGLYTLEEAPDNSACPSLNSFYIEQSSAQTTLLTESLALKGLAPEDDFSSEVNVLLSNTHYDCSLSYQKTDFTFEFLCHNLETKTLCPFYGLRQTLEVP